MHTQIEAIEALAHTQQLPERQAAMKKVKKRVPDLAALVDFWWAGVRQDLDHAGVSPLWQTWAQEALLPQVYWGYQVTRTRCPRRKAKMQQALEVVSLHVPRMCSPNACPAGLEEWHAWATRQVQAFQRASSAVKAATALWRSCTTISGDCPSSAIRYGQSCITSIVGLQMGRRQRHGFQADVSISL